MSDNHIVDQGECLSSIADAHGFFWETLWNHPNNADLKQARVDPNVLMPGDVVHIPDKQEKQESGATEQRHRFRKKGTPAKIRIRLLIGDKPRAHEPYVLQADDFEHRDVTDASGFLEAPIPPSAVRCILRVGKEGKEDIFELALGHMDPLDTDEGLSKRLLNLGYECEDDAGRAESIRAFQKAENLAETGDFDEQTKARLKDNYGR